MRNDLKFTYAKPNVGLWLRISNMVAGRRDRKGIFNHFIKENNIDTANMSTQAMSRKTYQIRTHYIEHLADVRDLAIHRKIQLVHKLQNEIDVEYSIYKRILSEQQKVLADFKKQELEVKQALKAAGLSALQKIHHQGDLGTLEASIQNQENMTSRTESDLTELTNAKKENLKTLDKYLEEARAVYDIALNQYTKIGGRMLQKIGYNLYDAQLRDFNNEIVKQIKDLKHGI